MPTPPAANSTTDARDYWDTVADEWTAARPHALWRRHSDAVNERWLAHALPAGRAARLLKTDLFDEAVGAGLYPALAARADAVLGLDLAGAAVAAAARRYPALRAVQADVRRLPFADGAFEVIVSNSTLDHFQTLAELRASLAELRRVLRPGGTLLLTLDNLANPILALRRVLPFTLLHRLGVLPYHVGASCGPRGLRRLAREAGFEVAELGALLHAPRVLAVALARLLERAGPTTQRRFLRGLRACEPLARWPTRYLTGHFVAARLVRPPAPASPPGGVATERSLHAH